MSKKTHALALSLLLAFFPHDASAGRATPRKKAATTYKTAKKKTKRRSTAKARKKAAVTRKRAKKKTRKRRAKKKTTAEKQPTIPKKQRAKAKKFFARGKKLFRQKKYDKAIVAFESAYSIWKHKVIEYNLALAHAFKGDKVTAGIYVRKYLEKAKGRERNLVSVLEQVLEDTGVLTVRTPDSKAAILVDGRQVGLGSAEVVVLAGKRAVDIAVNDRVVARRVVNMPPDGRKVWELFEVPTAPLPVQPRKTRAARGMKTTAVVPTPTPMPVRPVKRRASIRRLHWAYFTAAAGVAAAALGAGIGMWATIRKMDQDCRKAPCTNAEEKKGFTYQKITNAMWGVAGGAALAAGVLVIFTRWRKPEKQVSVLPAVSPGSVGLTVRLQH